MMGNEDAGDKIGRLAKALRGALSRKPREAPAITDPTVGARVNQMARRLASLTPLVHFDTTGFETLSRSEIDSKLADMQAAYLELKRLDSYHGSLTIVNAFTAQAVVAQRAKFGQAGWVLRDVSDYGNWLDHARDHSVAGPYDDAPDPLSRR